MNKSAQTPDYMEFSLLGRQTRKKCIEQDKVSSIAIIKAMENNKGGVLRRGVGEAQRKSH